MKSLEEFVNNKSINLDILEHKYMAIRLSNIDNYTINECCCDCCKCCGPCEDNPFIYFYSEAEIINKLKTTVTVQDLFHLHEQFGFKYRFKGENPGQVSEPLYFKELQGTPINTDLLGALDANTPNAQFNPKIHNFINNICQDYKLTYPIVLSRVDNKIQLFFIKGTGTNGEENSIKSSLIELYNILDKLDHDKYIDWSQVLDVSIDNCDDVYDFVITCTINANDFIYKPEIKDLDK